MRKAFTPCKTYKIKYNSYGEYTRQISEVRSLRYPVGS